MKHIRIASAAALFAALIVALSALTAGAQGLSDPGPSSAINLDNQRHVVPAGSALWLRFTHTASATGAQPATTLRMIFGNRRGLDFDIWMPDVATNWPQSQPLARGAPYEVNCDTGLAAAQGGCISNDLLWSGVLTTTGDYYARVTNANPFGVRVYLTGSGTGLDISAPVASVSRATATPLPVPVTGFGAASTTSGVLFNLDDPAKAFSFPRGQHVLAPQSGVWYIFDYPGTADPAERPKKTIRLVNGDGTGVNFKLYAAEDLHTWWERPHLGQGTTYTIDCDTGAPASDTGCHTKDLVWVGAFPVAARFYVRVYNENLTPTSFRLTIE